MVDLPPYVKPVGLGFLVLLLVIGNIVAIDSYKKAKAEKCTVNLKNQLGYQGLVLALVLLSVILFAYDFYKNRTIPPSL